MKISVAGENALIIYFDDQARKDLPAYIQSVAEHLTTNIPEGLLDLVPAYQSLLLVYDLACLDQFELRKIIASAVTTAMATSRQPETFELPVFYSTESGADLERLAINAGLSIDDVIHLHCSKPYDVYAIGFSPGFAYLGDVDNSIATPRLATPRLSVPKGSVAIADKQTAVYPSASPGGWNLIGRCPAKIFDVTRKPPVLAQVGDQIRFFPVNRNDYLKLGGEL